MGFLLILFLNRNTPIRLILPRISQKIQVKILGLILFSLLFLRSPIERIMNGRDETISIRLEYAKAALVRFADSPILGRGWGTGPVELPAFSNFFFYSWEMQPVHNIYLLVVSDLGIIGLSIFLYFIYRVLVGPKNIWKYLFIAYLVIGLLDHYLLTLPQGIFIFFASALLADVLEQKKERIPTKV
jgi:O-antigen ligase